jgi:hypothetical protein
MRIYIASRNTRSSNARERRWYTSSDALVRERPKGGSRLRRRGPNGSSVGDGTLNTLNEATQLKIVHEAKGCTKLAGIESHYRVFGHSLESEQRCERSSPLLVETCNRDPLYWAIGRTHSPRKLLPHRVERTEGIPFHCDVDWVPGHQPSP